MTRRPALVVAALAVLAAVLPTGASPARAAQPDGDALAALEPPVRVSGGADAVLDLAEHGRRLGAVELSPEDGGSILLVTDAPLESYVEGIAEMPPTWPAEALKAQAVAARTYALFERAQGRWRGQGFDICATTACQVFDGRAIVDRPLVGERWRAAVAATAGEVLLHDGAPALARYHSSSGGRTRANEEVYPSEGPRPYLVAVDDAPDAVSPWHRWEVRFERSAFDAITAEGRKLSTVTPIETIRVHRRPGSTDAVTATGAGGRRVTVSASEFRSFVSAVAPRLFPGRYPSVTATGRRLPLTLPSSRFRIDLGADGIVITGRGFGHGVGMSQYGARGRAEAGASYERILAHYYRGLAPTRRGDLPERIRVGERVSGPVRLSADRPLVLRAGGTVVSRRALGTWSFEVAGSRLRAVPPAGYGAALEVGATRTARAVVPSTGVIDLTTDVNKPAELVLVVHDASGERRLRRPLAVVERGGHGATWDLDDATGRQLPPGTYQVALRAVDERGRSAGRPVTVEVTAVRGGRLDTLLAATPPPLPRRGPAALLVAAAGAAVGLSVGGALRRRGARAAPV